jgi:phosphoribosylaminoimidazole-succinocarboxamide synthase
MLADEIHTPDSSRYWHRASYQSRFEAGQRPDSFDKDFVRSWVAERCDPYADEIPEIPQDLIIGTAAVYVEAFEKIVGRSFVPDLDGTSVLERVRANLTPFFLGQPPR